ncbi:FAD-dependent monooxygenase [Luteipulveratus sp. YIM 133132]|uniref:FAD-dependent oxidoreductase n=1 Tax=Luteipulveratus flavus TaxID=3031728 RepID=UPI0023B145F0|nr:FAD-dependent monooxygenase [Luteipulveratus sp. YIM 133132]MDE9364714.1 FAD-dependent monooxygenase [Luteipulveratus sp. YIM 133132]
MTQRMSRAVVIGGSLAGLLSASALADHADEVVVLDRDRLPDEPLARSGVPQSQHVHGLLASGREAMEELLPGLTDELCALGGELGDFQDRTQFYVGDRTLAGGTSGLLALAVSRPLLEHRVRTRVAALPNVTIRERTTVLDLVLDDESGPTARVVGVAVAPLDGVAGPEKAPSGVETVPADLVVDASGRTARTPEWLERRGFPAPAEERVRIDVAYATRQFRRSATHADGLVAVLQPSSPELPRSAIMLAQEGDRWIVGLTGYHGVRPPTDLEEFIAYAATHPGPVGRMLPTLEPLDDGATYRFAANVRRRYEKVRRFPAGLLVTGDALCAFDPAYGQGMSVAALEALELRGCLADGTDDLARRFFARAARHVDTPWTLVVGRDRELPGSTDPAPWATRMMNRYVGALLRAACDDAELATVFLRVSHLAAPPSTLMTPRVVAKVARAALRRGPADRTRRRDQEEGGQTKGRPGASTPSPA